MRWPVLTLASIVQTIPGLALLALFYPVLLALSSVSERLFGTGFSALGFLPSLLALTLYSMLPVIRNGVAAILNLDPAVIEAARGVGMTDWQRLRRVELPLAAPLLMAGVRTAAVWVIGAATLATPVGQTSLGNYIFSGLQTQNWVAVLFGCVAAAALALVVDQLLGLIESGVGCGGPPDRDRRARSRGRHRRRRTAARRDAAGGYVIGAKSFSEQYILAALLAAPARRRRRLGVATRGARLGDRVRRARRGRRRRVRRLFGTLWANVLQRTDNPPRADCCARRATGSRPTRHRAARRARFRECLRVRDAPQPRRSSGSDDRRSRGALARSARGRRLRVLRAARVARAARRVRARVRESPRVRSTFMYGAVASGEVDVITAFSSDGRIAADDLVVLEDPNRAILPYDAIVLIAEHRATDPLLRRALEPLIGAIPVELMREANYRVDRDTGKQTPAAVARWLASSQIAARSVGVTGNVQILYLNSEREPVAPIPPCCSAWPC